MHHKSGFINIRKFTEDKNVTVLIAGYFLVNKIMKLKATFTTNTDKDASNMLVVDRLNIDNLYQL